MVGDKAINGWRQGIKWLATGHKKRAAPFKNHPILPSSLVG